MPPVYLLSCSISPWGCWRKALTQGNSDRGGEEGQNRRKGEALTHGDAVLKPEARQCFAQECKSSLRSSSRAWELCLPDAQKAVCLQTTKEQMLPGGSGWSFRH